MKMKLFPALLCTVALTGAMNTAFSMDKLGGDTGDSDVYDGSKETPRQKYRNKVAEEHKALMQKNHQEVLAQLQEMDRRRDAAREELRNDPNGWKAKRAEKDALDEQRYQAIMAVLIELKEKVQFLVDERNSPERKARHDEQKEHRKKVETVLENKKSY